jgi:hypothetical protein
LFPTLGRNYTKYKVVTAGESVPAYISTISLDTVLLNMNRLWFPLIIVLAMSPFAANGDTFQLRSGGEIDGELLNPNELPRKSYVIKTELGEVSLPKDAVEKRIVRRPAEIELEKLRHQHPDTVEGQWALAEWCRTNGLTEPRKQFLQRVIELDPDHADARRHLGYGKFDGKWQTRDEVQTSRGYVKHKGKWMLPQEVEAMQATEREGAERKQWFQKIELWRGWYVGNRSAEGKANLLAIKDPLAVEALASRMNTDHNDVVRLLVVEVLANIGNDAALRVLAQRSLDDPNQEVRLTCVDYLAKNSRPTIVKLFIDKLRDKDNNVINRAGIALKRLKDPTSTGALIEALVTKHKILISPGTPAGQTTTSFSNMGGGFAAGGAKPQYINQPYENQDVLDALIAITGANFNFDVVAWKKWYASQRRA